MGRDLGRGWVALGRAGGVGRGGWVATWVAGGSRWVARGAAAPGSGNFQKYMKLGRKVLKLKKKLWN